MQLAAGADRWVRFAHPSGGSAPNPLCGLMTTARKVRIAAVVVVLLALWAWNRSSDDDRFLPEHIGVLEMTLMGGFDECEVESERWGCEEAGKRVVLGFFQGGKLVAQHPTFVGTRFRLELPDGQYELRVIEPRGTYVSSSRVGVDGGAIVRGDLIWPVDKKSAERIRRLDLEDYGGSPR